MGGTTVAAVRLDLNAHALPWFISGQHTGAIWQNITAVNGSLTAMAQQEQQVFIIGTSHLPHGRLHFGSKGTLLPGQEFAGAYLKTK